MSCRREYPYFEQLYRELKATGIKVIAQNYQNHKFASQEQQYLSQIRARYGSSMPVLFTDEWATGILVLDHNGTVIYDGTFRLNEIRAAVRRLLVQ